MKKMIISSHTLLKAMQQNGKVFRKKNVLPPLDYFFMDVLAMNRKNSKARLVTSDLENFIINDIPCEARQSFRLMFPGEVVKFLEKLDEQPLVISANEKTFEITISTDKRNVTYKGYNPEEFPVVPKFRCSNEIDMTEIGSFLQFTGNDSIRPVMSGVNISQHKKGVCLTSTNAHMLKSANVKGTGITGIDQIILPPAACKLLKYYKAAMCDYGVTTEKREKKKWAVHVRFDVTDQLSIITRVIDGKYPNIEPVIPKQSSTWVTAPVEDMLNVITKASEHSTHPIKPVKFIMNGTTEIFSINAEKGKDFKAKRKWSKTGEDLTIGFNSSLLSTVLKDLKNDEVTLSLGAPNRATVIKENKTMWLVMPFMLEREDMVQEEKVRRKKVKEEKASEENLTPEEETMMEEKIEELQQAPVMENVEIRKPNRFFAFMKKLFSYR